MPHHVRTAAFRRLMRIRRLALNVVHAASRMKILMFKAPLTAAERRMVARIYYSAGAMREIPAVGDLLSSIGISSGYDDIEAFLDRAGYVKGSVLRWNHFESLVRQLKKKFVKDASVPDTHIAFMALGGGADLGGDISADKLRSVCHNFRLTIDIDAFIAEHDEDASGRLEFNEFSAMFGDEGEDPRKKFLRLPMLVLCGRTFHTFAALNRHQSTVGEVPSLPPTNEAAVSDAAKDAPAPLEVAVEKEPSQLIRGVARWLRDTPVLLREKHLLKPTPIAPKTARTPLWRRERVDAGNTQTEVKTARKPNRKLSTMSGSSTKLQQQHPRRNIPRRPNLRDGPPQMERFEKAMMQTRTLPRERHPVPPNAPLPTLRKRQEPRDADFDPFAQKSVPEPDWGALVVRPPA